MTEQKRTWTLAVSTTGDLDHWVPARALEMSGVPFRALCGVRARAGWMERDKSEGIRLNMCSRCQRRMQRKIEQWEADGKRKPLTDYLPS